jgi:hypothetical protein
MLVAGDRIPLEAFVWLGPNVPHPLGVIVAEGATLLLFYPFDWSST